MTESSDDIFTAQCPECLGFMRTYRRSIGKRIRCPHCKQSFVLPPPEDQETQAENAAGLACEYIGSEIATRFIDECHNLTRHTGNLPVEYDQQTVAGELAILAYHSYRLALEFADLPYEQMTKIRVVFDRKAYPFIGIQGDELRLDRREKQYSDLVRYYNDQIRRGNFEKFAHSLATMFDQFCRGGGEDGSPFVIGNIFSMMHIVRLSSQCWATGFLNTLDYLKSMRIAQK